MSMHHKKEARLSIALPSDSELDPDPAVVKQQLRLQADQMERRQLREATERSRKRRWLTIGVEIAIVAAASALFLWLGFGS